MTGKRLTTTQAAEILGVSNKTIARWYHIGVLTGIQPNSKILIDAASIEKAKRGKDRRDAREARELAAIQPIRRKRDNRDIK